MKTAKLPKPREPLKEKIEGLKRQMQYLKDMEKRVEAAPDHQVSLIDPDARSMATSGKGTGTVGYNVQVAVDAEHHLIVAHEVTNTGHDRSQLASMGKKALEATGNEEITALADRGYYDSEEVLACEGTGVLPYVPKTQTSTMRTRPVQRARFYLRRHERSLHLPGRRKPNQRRGAFGPEAQCRQIPQPDRLLELRTQAQVHAQFPGHARQN